MSVIESARLCFGAVSIGNFVKNSMNTGGASSLAAKKVSQQIKLMNP